MHLVGITADKTNNTTLFANFRALRNLAGDEIFDGQPIQVELQTR